MANLDTLNDTHDDKHEQITRQTYENINDYFSARDSSHQEQKDMLISEASEVEISLQAISTNETEQYYYQDKKLLSEDLISSSYYAGKQSEYDQYDEYQQNYLQRYLEAALDTTTKSGYADLKFTKKTEYDDIFSSYLKPKINLDVYNEILEKNFSKKEFIYSSNQLVENFSYRDLAAIEQKFQQLNTDKIAWPTNSIPHTSALLWKAEKTGYAPVYLFSTVHTAAFDPAPIFEAAIDNLVSQCDQVYTEIDLPLCSHQEIIIDGQLETIHHLDNYVAQRAYQQNKVLLPLEAEAIREFLNTYSARVSGQEMLDAIAQDFGLLHGQGVHYLESSDALAKLAEDPLYINDYKRNIFWMNSILSASLAGQTALIAVGSGHNYGQFGLPNFLQMAGYTVKPLMKQAPNPNMSLVSPFLFWKQPKDESRVEVIEENNQEQNNPAAVI